MNILFTLSFLFLFIVSAQAQGQSEEQRFSRDTVAQMLLTGDILSVEDFLLAVSRLGPEDLFNNYVLMFDSKSRQEGSFKEPRAIIFSPKQEFVMAFNGGGHQRGGNQVEIMQFNKEQRAFEFFEVDFNGPSPHLSSVNPPRCQACHRKDPRPNWDYYFFWAGMYGGDDDRLISNIYFIWQEHGKSALENPSPSIRATYPDIFETQEGQQYLQFILYRRPEHLRYSLLREYPIPSFASSRSFPFPYMEFPRPGLALTRLLVDLNQQRIQRDIEVIIEQVPHLKYALLGAVNNCISTPRQFSVDFFPPHFFREQKISPEDYWKNAINHIRTDLTDRIRRHEVVTGDDTSQRGRLKESFHLDIIHYEGALLWSQYIIQLAGLEKRHWSLSFSNVPIIFNGRASALVEQDFVSSLLGLRYEDFSYVSLCNYLAQKSRQALREE